MKDLWLPEVPRIRKVYDALHQKKLVSITTEGNRRFSFAPKATEFGEMSDEIFIGEYFQIINKRYSEITGVGKLVFSDLTTREPSARLLLEDDSSIL